MLINTFWFIPFVFAGVASMGLLLLLIHRFGWYIGQTLSTVITIVGIITLIILTAAPGIVQVDFMVECEISEVEFASELLGTQTVELKQCRYKDNYYGDFGEWQLVGLQR
jgi:hypothetical protein